jgi:hypothetical protein
VKKETMFLCLCVLALCAVSTAIAAICPDAEGERCILALAETEAGHEVFNTFAPPLETGEAYTDPTPDNQAYNIRTDGKRIYDIFKKQPPALFEDSVWPQDIASMPNANEEFWAVRDEPGVMLGAYAESEENAQDEVAWMNRWNTKLNVFHEQLPLNDMPTEVTNTVS